MDLHTDNSDDRRMAIQLGPVERWVVGAASLALLSIGGWTANAVSTRLDRLSDQQAALATTQAVMTQQLATLNVQLADVPAIARQVAENKVRIDQMAGDINRLQEKSK